MTEQEAQGKLFRFDDARLGAFGEAIWSSVFRATGIGYVPLSKIEIGKAPAIEGDNRIVLPDFHLLGEAFTAYVDSKCKTQSVLWRKTNQVRHGIDRKNYLQYLRAAQLGRTCCAIGIVELYTHEMRWSGSLLLETLDELGTPVDGESNQRHMVYWAHKMFRNLNSFSAIELLEIANGQKRVSFKHEFERIFGAKLRQKELFV